MKRFWIRLCWLDIILFFWVFSTVRKEIFWSHSKVESTMRYLKKYLKNIIFVKFLCLDKFEFLWGSNWVLSWNCQKRSWFWSNPNFHLVHLNGDLFYRESQNFEEVIANILLTCLFQKKRNLSSMFNSMLM